MRLSMPQESGRLSRSRIGVFSMRFEEGYLLFEADLGGAVAGHGFEHCERRVHGTFWLDWLYEVMTHISRNVEGIS